MVVRGGVGPPGVALLCAGLIAGCAGAASTTVTRTGPPTVTTSTSATSSRAAGRTRGAFVAHRRLPVTAKRPAHGEQRPGPAPGTLPQTSALPAAHTRTFRAEMAALWRGIRNNSVRAALPAFFPEAAYAQLKGIADPTGDWQGRLVADYQLDVAAAHLLLAPHPDAARLVSVQVPAAYAHWVPPGVCSNTAGYYEVPNARVVYRSDGEVRSFGIASMISWRGVWYVVHLGAVLRPTGGGIVDDPSTGPGVSAYSSTC